MKYDSKQQRIKMVFWQLQQKNKMLESKRKKLNFTMIAIDYLDLRLFKLLTYGPITVLYGFIC